MLTEQQIKCLRKYIKGARLVLKGRDRYWVISSIKKHPNDGELCIFYKEGGASLVEDVNFQDFKLLVDIDDCASTCVKGKKNG